MERKARKMEIKEAFFVLPTFCSSEVSLVLRDKEEKKDKSKENKREVGVLILI